MSGAAWPWQSAGGTNICSSAPICASRCRGELRILDGEIFGEVGSRSSALVVDDDLTMASNDPLDGRLGYIGWSDLRSFEAGGQIGVDEPAVDADHLDTPGSDTKTPGG